MHDRIKLHELDGPDAGRCWSLGKVRYVGWKMEGYFSQDSLFRPIFTGKLHHDWRGFEFEGEKGADPPGEALCHCLRSCLGSQIQVTD